MTGGSRWREAAHQGAVRGAVRGSGSAGYNPVAAPGIRPISGNGATNLRATGRKYSRSGRNTHQIADWRYIFPIGKIVLSNARNPANIPERE